MSSRDLPIVGIETQLSKGTHLCGTIPTYQDIKKSQIEKFKIITENRGKKKKNG
jgi:hypothetical protein